MPSFQDAIPEMEILVSFSAPMVECQALPPVILELPLKKRGFPHSGSRDGTGEESQMYTRAVPGGLKYEGTRV